MNRHGTGRSWLIGLALAVLGSGSLPFADQAAAAPTTTQWPTAASWQQDALGDKTSNLVVDPASVSMTPLAASPNVTPSVIATGLDTPWAIRFAPGGKLFISERPGRVRVFENNQLNPTPVLTIAGTETLSAEEGLQGMALDPSFSDNGFMYLYYTYNPGDGTMKNRVARYTIQGNASVGTPLTLVDAIPGSRFHNGGRIAFGPDGKLYIATGAADADAAAQNLGSLAGKILRVNPDGTIPADNPFPGSPVYSLGHRNPQGLAWHPVTGALWSTEHGPTGTPPYCCHDEINVITPGGNYGWPKYYGTLPVPEYGNLTVDSQISPVYESGDGKWAPGGATFYTGDQLAGPWTNRLLFAGLGFQNAGGRALYRLGIDTDNATPTQLDSVLVNQFGRLRDIVQGPDGSLYVATSNRDGRGQPIAEDDRIVKLSPAFDPAGASASFTLSYDAGAGKTTDWTSLSAESDLPTGTSIRYETQSSGDGISYSAFSDGIASAPNGRYLRIRVSLSSQRAGVSASLRRLSVTHDLVANPPPGGVFCAGSTAAICEGFDTSAANFSTTGGTWGPADGRYVLSNPNTTSGDVVKNRAVHSASISGDFAISVRATATPSSAISNDVAVIFGYANATNYWALSVAENNSTGNHGVFRIVNNSWTQVADITAAGSQLADGIDYRLRLERTGSTLRAYRNDVLILTTTQTSLPAGGRVGVGSINDAASFDDLLVTATPPPPPPPPPAAFCSGSTAAICEDFSTSATSFTTSGGVWSVASGRYNLSGPATTGTAVVNRAIHRTSISGGFTLRAKLTPTASSAISNDVALIFGYQNPTNYWFVSLAENNSAGNHGLFRLANGVQTQVVDFASTHQIRDATTYDVRLERAGNVLRVFRNTVQIASTTQTTVPAAGLVGLGSINDPASFDELQVTQP